MTAPHGLAFLSIGSPQHAITALSLAIASSAREGTAVQVVDPADLIPALRGLPSSVRLVHLHTNDWLLRAPGRDAADVLAAAAADLARRGAELSVTLHDLPQRSSPLYQARAQTYCRMIDVAKAVFVSSCHEEDLVSEFAESALVRVIPLPVDRRAVPTRPPSENPPAVGILGYIYPGKGHREVLDELSGSGVEIRALGRPSDGQEYLADDLRDFARRRGVRFTITGWIPDRELTRALHRVAVPIAPHVEVSASGSINAWIAAGRRPLVTAGRYSDELLTRMPDAVRPYRPGTLTEQVGLALADPAATWLPDDAGYGSTTAEVAEEYVRVLTELL